MSELLLPAGGRMRAACRLVCALRKKARAWGKAPRAAEWQPMDMPGEQSQPGPGSALQSQNWVEERQSSLQPLTVLND